MALIRDADGQSFELMPLAYQFPTPDNKLGSDRDANWLHVKIRVITPTRSWEREDPALYSWSFYGIASWMREVVAGRGESGWYYPLDEPNVAFGWEAAHRAIRLRLLFSQEFRPPTHDDDYELRMLVRSGSLLRFAGQLERAVRQFPIRTWGTDPSTARIAERYEQMLQRL